MNAQRARIVAGGRLQVPADMRRILGLSDGDPVTVRIIDGELHVRPVGDPLSRIQAKLRTYQPVDAVPLEAPIANHGVDTCHE